MSTQNNLTDFLTSVADSIRAKKETSALINPQDFPTEIASIPSGSSLGYNVTFVANGNDYYLASVPVGGAVEEPADPSAEGYSLVGWFTQENGGGSEVFFPYTPTADITLYAYIVAETFITFSSDEPFDFGVANKTKNWNGTLYISTDKVNWTTWDGTTDVSAIKHLGKYSVSLRGSNNTFLTGSTDLLKRFVFYGSTIFCEGNIENILDYTVVANGNHPTMATYCFTNLFYQAHIVNSPKLPAPILADYCYYSMFDGSWLSIPPSLPSTELGNYCYYCMFRDTAITEAPSLPAITLKNRCYQAMFSGCRNLVSPPDLPAITATAYCYSAMFANCTKLKTPPTIKLKTLLSDCCSSMFSSCTSLTSLPELPITTLANYCYSSMFLGCTGIKLSTTQTEEYQNEYRIPSSGTGTTASSALRDMFAGTGGTFTGTPTINTTYYTSNAVMRNIALSLSNVSGAASNPTTITNGETANLYFTADSGYSLPSSVTVTGASYTWNNSTGQLVLSNPTAPVSVSIAGQAQTQTLVGGETYENLSGEYDFTLNEWENITVNFTTAYGQNVYIKVTANALDSEDEFLVDKFINGSYSSGSYVNNIPPDSPYTTSSGISSSQSLSYELISEMTTASGKIIFSPSPIT